MTAEPKRRVRGTPETVPLPKRTKSLVLEGGVAARLEALAEALHRTESAVANEILDKGTAQMILERVPQAARRGPLLHHPMGRIEGALRIRGLEGPEREDPRTYSFEVVGEAPGAEGQAPVLLTLVSVFDAERRLWRRLEDREVSQLVRDVHGGGGLFVVTPAGIRWALVEVRDVVYRDLVPPRREVLARLRRVPADVCPACRAPLGASRRPAASYECTNADCRRSYAVGRNGNLEPVSVPAEADPKTAPLTFAQLRGILASAPPVTAEDLARARRGRNVDP